MAHLSLSVGADDLEVPGGHEETVHLLWGGLVEQCGQEHPQMEIQGLWSVRVHTARPRNTGMGGGQNGKDKQVVMRKKGKEGV